MRALSGEREGWFPRALLARAAAAPPAGGRFACAVMLADVSGFTALTERLAERGPAGAERLTELLNARFGGIIEAIIAHGGDITHFAGDAIVAVWPADGTRDPGGHARRAHACARAVQSLPAAAAEDAAPLRVRVGLAAGDAWWAILGGDDERVFVVGGAPVAEAGAAAANGAPGAVTVSAGSAAAFAAGGGAMGPGPEHELPARDARADRLDAFLPAPLRRRLAAGEQWLAEFRRVTVLFASFGGAEFASPERLADAQGAVLAAQAVVARFDGSIHQLVADGPGATLIAAWGLPQLTHEDDARRGAEAAMAIERELAARGMPCAIGVTTGRVFCGVRGNAARREWAMLGDTMNLAARLMRAAVRGVLCDEETAAAARARIAFTAVPPVTVKGKSRPVPAFRPSGEAAAGAPVRAAAALVGRDTEAARIAARLGDLVSRRAGGVLILEGEAGIGKSELLAMAEASAAEAGAVVARGNADAIENATAYFVWRAVLAQLIAAAGGVTAALGDAALMERAPLLNDILALDLPETAVTAAMEPQGRADALRDLVAAIVRRSAARAPLLVVLDDAHWFDSASWAMAAAAARLAPQALFLIATRPVMEPQPPAYRQLVAAGAERMTVPPLAPADALALVRRRLQVDVLPRAAETVIGEKAQGNPFFSEQLALSLRDGGLLVIEGRTCRLAPHAGDLRDIALPDTVQGAISGRLDRLDAPEQLTLKVASVIGRVFPFRTLSALYPEEPVRPSLRRHSEHLTEIDLTRVDAPEPALAHLFTHVITQQVAYDLMSFAQRRELHRALALWYETEYQSGLAPYYPLLAHHWAAAGQPAPAVRYLSSAATQALERFANEEVVRFVRDARALAASGRLDVDDAQRSVWELQEGEALLKLARYAESRTHFLESLRLLGRPVPRSRARLAWRIAAESARQAARRMRDRRGSASSRGESRVPSPAQSQSLQAAHVHQRLAEVGYWDHDILTLVHSAVTSLNYAEPAGESRQLHSRTTCSASSAGWRDRARCSTATAGALARWGRARGTSRRRRSAPSSMRSTSTARRAGRRCMRPHSARARCSSGSASASAGRRAWCCVRGGRSIRAMWPARARCSRTRAGWLVRRAPHRCRRGAPRGCSRWSSRRTVARRPAA